jgi:short-subunit dehydrogenase
MIAALVTGATKGIGLEFCRQLAARPLPASQRQHSSLVRLES